MALLDENGVLYLWNKIKAKFATQDSLVSEIKTLKESMSSLGYGDMMKSTYDTDGDGIVDNAQKVNGHTVNSDVPSDAKFTDTTYEHFYEGTSTSNPTLGLVRGPEYGVGDYAFYTARQGWQELNLQFVQSNGQVKLYQIYDDEAVELGAFPTATTEKAGTMSAAQFTKLNNCLTESQIQELYALKSDITGVYKYKGSVASASALPTSGQTKGDVYNIEAASSYGGAGMNVAWDGSKWDSLGEIFSVTTITNAQIDTICV